LFANFFSFYYVVTKLYSEDIASRAVFFLFLFPFSIFYRSYFTEGLFLLLLLWFAYFTLQKRWLQAVICSAFLSITKPYGIVFLPILLINLYFSIQKKEVTWRQAYLYLFLSTVPLLIWFYFCYIQTGNPFYWQVAESIFYPANNVIFSNLKQIFLFWSLPFHGFHESKVDVSTLVFTFVLLLLSRKFLKPQLWSISLLLWFAPLLTKDLMSYTRFEIVSFPLFIYLGAKIKGVSFYVVSGMFLVGLFVTSLYFINWYWIG